MKWLKISTDLFPFWLLLGCAISFTQPDWFSWLDSSTIATALGIIMLMMGLTISAQDFIAVFKMPKWILTGLFLQYTIMPLTGWTISQMMGLPPFLALGVVLVSCCPGGTASNVITFLAKGNIALSVSMTSISTALGIFLTPLLTALLADSKIQVPAGGLLLSTIKVILLPVTAGIVIQRFLPGFTKKVIPYAPLLSIVLIVMIVSGIIGGGKEYILQAGFQLLGAVILLHVSGFLWGYILTYFLFRNKTVSRTISIEVGMQNSGLGVVLAKQNFSNPAAAIPAALSSLVHSMIGSLLSAIWRRK
jgi:BASS family bile acid:Na+ symporter